MKISCGILIILSIYFVQGTIGTTNRIVCYFGSWATYRNGNGKFDVENIDPALCTNLIYTFVGLNEDGTIKVLDPYNDLDDNWGKGGFRRFNNLKKLSPTAKTSIAIGGWNEGSEKYSNVMSNAVLRKVFVQDAVNFLQKYGFDGFDFDWEYPNQRGGQQQDVENFVEVLKELKEAFAPHGFLLSGAVAAAKPSVNQSYNIPEVSKYLDFINVMAYDLHGTWDQITGENAPLYPLKDETDYQRELNVVACVDTWIKGGADPSKIMLGMGTYGRTFTLDNSANHGLRAPAVNPGNGGPYTNEPGMIGYNEIVEVTQQGGWTSVWNDEQQVPYMYKGNQWVGYDDPKSITLKVQYALSKNLGGCMIWSIETDDFHGLSGQKYILLNTINSAMGRNVPVTSTLPSTVPTTVTWWTPDPTTEHSDTTYHTNPTDHTKTTSDSPYTSTSNPGPNPDPAKWCKEEGYIRDHFDCSKFYYCQLQEDGTFKAIPFSCNYPLVFDLTIIACNYPNDTDCTNGLKYFEN